jgi:TPR repeat protein/parvulin-like peptidyl-prolyl isomerase
MKTRLKVISLSALLLVLQSAVEGRLHAQAHSLSEAEQFTTDTRASPFPAAIMAVVNDRIILYSAVRDKAERRFAVLRHVYRDQPQRLQEEAAKELQQVLESLVNDELMLADAEASGFTVSKEHLDQIIGGLVQTNYFGNTNEFLQSLSAAGLTLEDFREQHRRADLIAAAKAAKLLFARRPEIAEIEDYYRSHEKDFQTEASVRLSVIVLNRSPASSPAVVELQRKLAPELLTRNPTNSPPAVEVQRRVAAELLARLKKDADFAEVAKAYSEGSHSRDGGDFGWIEQPALRKELADVAFSLKPGELSEVIETDAGWFLLRVAERRSANVKPLAEVREQIVKQLDAQARATIIQEWLDGLRAKSFIQHLDGGGGQPVPPLSCVKAIEIRHVGPSTVSDAAVRAQIHTQIGEPVNRAVLDRDMRNLHATGNFRNLCVQARPADKEILLTYFLQERPAVSGIQFSGNKALGSADLLPKLLTKPGARLDEYKLFKDAQTIQRQYRDAGQPRAAVKYVLNVDEPAGKGSVTFNITENAKAPQQTNALPASGRSESQPTPAPTLSKTNVTEADRSRLADLSARAQQGDAAAQSDLGRAYFFGLLGLATNPALAAELLRKSADQNHPKGQYRLGMLYLLGGGVEKNLAEAVELFRKAAALGNPEAQSKLGVLYLFGQGVQRDVGEALKWIRPAADKGIAEAQNNLGWMYLQGEGLDKNSTEGARWFRKAAEQNFPEAQGNLAGCYLNGLGLAKDELEAYKWYSLAAQQGIEKAKQNTDMIESRLSSKQLAEARQWVQQWLEQHRAAPSVKEGPAAGRARSN